MTLLSIVNDKIFNIKKYGAVGNGVTDDTVSIQATIEACYNSGGGIVYFPKGIYVLAGALQTNYNGVDYNSQLCIPKNLYNDTTKRSIHLKGEVSPNFVTSGGVTGVLPNTSGSILKSTITGSGTNPSMISCGPKDSDGVLGNSYNQNIFENLLFYPVVDGSNKLTIGGINGRGVDNLNLRRVVYAPWGVSVLNTTEPDSSVTAFAMPQQACDDNNIVDQISAAGAYNGLVVGEHTFIKHAIFRDCYNGLAIPTTSHMVTALRLSTSWCKNAITSIGSTARLQVHQLDLEFKTGVSWFYSQYVVNDANGFIRGKIYYHQWDNDVSNVTKTLVNNGGHNVELIPISYHQQYKMLSDEVDDYRIGVRGGSFVCDKTLTATGFLGEEDIDWENIFTSA